MTALVVGFGLGFLVAAQLGPISLLAIRSTLRNGVYVGLAIGGGVAVIDTLYAAAGAAGAAGLLAIEPLRLAFGLVGAVVLAVLGARTLWSAFRIRMGGESQEELATPRAAFVTALAATASNPLTIASWAAVFAAASTAGAGSGALLLAGVGLGSLTWMTMLAGGVSVARRWVGPRLLRTVDGVAGAGVLGFGALLAYRTSRATERSAHAHRHRSAVAPRPRAQAPPRGRHHPGVRRRLRGQARGRPGLHPRGRPRELGQGGEAGGGRLALTPRMAYYVTTPIYYVNAAPHLGHAYTTIGADILARHMRQRGEEVFFLTGTDEHGEPVAQAAEREGVTPKELADRNAERFLALLPRINVSNDFFIRTSDPRHHERVQEVMQRIHDNGHTYKGLYEGWYCPRCADFKTENEIGPDNTCPIHKTPLDREREENWFFRLSAFQEPLEKLYAERPDFVTPRHRYNEALAFISGGLNDVSLSRAKSKLSWGVQVPWDPDHVFYVWFDALLNYYTALGFARDGEDLTSVFWPTTYHVMAKDILKFHAVFWPAMLMAADIELPEHLFIHGYLLMKDASGSEHKMSKSLGNVLDPFEVMDTFGTDALRYYCFREVSFGQDGGVSTITFGERYETELANEYGNLASRTLAMIDRYREGIVPGGRRRPRAGRRLRGSARGGRAAARPCRADAGARAHLAARAAAQPLRRGARAVAARQGRGQGG